MADLVERIARAIGEAELDDGPPLHSAARAVLATLAEAGLVIVPREPSEAMIDAGKQVAFRALAGTAKPGTIKTLLYTGVEEYRAMVAAAEAENRDA